MMNLEDLKIFKDTRRRNNGPYIYIRKNRTIGLSTGFCDIAKPDLENMDFVKFLYSKKQNTVVFDFLKSGFDEDQEKIKGSVKLTRSDSYSSMQIAGSSFFHYYDIDLEKHAGKYTAHKDFIPQLGKEHWFFCLDDIKNEKY